METLQNASAGNHPASKFFKFGSGAGIAKSIAAIGLGLAVATSAVAADRSHATPKTHDAMNSQEQQRAMRSLERETAPVSAAAQEQRYSASSVAPPAPQLLLMERRRDKGASARLADAWYYNYQYNETTHKVVDLTSGSVVSSEVVIGTQLPLVETEVTRAFDILLASGPDRRALEQAYKAITGKRFEKRTQVSYKAFIFHQDTVVDGLTAAARRCGVNRCAQILIYTHDNIALDTAPVVDLSTSQVLQNLELRAREIARRPVPAVSPSQGVER